MSVEVRRSASEIVRQVWPDECEIAGETVVAQMTERPGIYDRPTAGDHIDLMPILEVLKGAIELVAACLSLYTAASALRGAEAGVKGGPDHELDGKLAQATRDRTITTEQAAELRRLILDRV